MNKEYCNENPPKDTDYYSNEYLKIPFLMYIKDLESFALLPILHR